MVTRGRANVVLITCDCLRSDCVGCCSAGAIPSLTPNLDSLAAQGVTFTNAIAQGFRTNISMPSLFTGRYPSGLKWLTVPSPWALRRQIRGVALGQEGSIARILAEHDYATAAFHSNPLLSRVFGFDRGFQVFDDSMPLPNVMLPQALRRWAYRVPLLLRGTSHVPAATINARAIAWLMRASHPFFLWLHYMDTHGPYRTQDGTPYPRRLRAQMLYQRAMSKPESITERERDLLLNAYREEVNYLDEHMGRLFDELERMGRMDDTLIVVTADHGEEFREHGAFNHHPTLYDELLRVPLILKLPRAECGGQVFREAVGLVQVLPTILDILGIQAQGDLDGTSLIPLLEARNGRGLLGHVISEARGMPQYKACIREGPWKLIVDTRKQRRELYRLADDPGELRNMIAEEPDVARQLEETLVSQLIRIGGLDRRPEATAAGMSPDVLVRLRDLGYL